MSTSNSLDSVYFITLPENFQISKNAAHIDPTIPLPVQKKAEDAPGNFNMEELSPEQILSGILTVLAYDKDNRHLPYYRSVLKSALPDIQKELTETAIIKIKNEEFDEAEEILAALRGFDPDDMSAVLNTALMLDQRAEFYRQQSLNDDADACDAEALEYYNRAMEADPPVPDAYFNAGFYYLKQRDFLQARDCFEEFLALTCNLPDDELGKNGAYKKERAQEILNNIKNDNIDDQKFKAAYDFISKGQNEKGLEQIREFLQSNPHVWNAWFLLGWGLRRMERYEDAQKAFTTALQYGGDKNADTYNELSICYVEMQDYAQARHCLEKALALSPESVKIISNLGYLALKEGKPAEAQKYFTTVLEYDPDDKIALAELKKLEA